MLALQVEPIGQPVHLEGDAGLERDLVDPVEVERVLGPMSDQPPCRMAEAAHRGMTHRLGHSRGQLRARRPLTRVERELHPVELGQDVVGKVERAVAPDVAFDAA